MDFHLDHRHHQVSLDFHLDHRHHQVSLDFHLDIFSLVNTKLVTTCRSGPLPVYCVPNYNSCGYRVPSKPWSIC
jgi:hypothetical protein